MIKPSFQCTGKDGCLVNSVGPTAYSPGRNKSRPLPHTIWKQK